MTPGTRIDRYEVEALVGRGGMAEVYRVRHLQLGTLHALKLLVGPTAPLTDRLLLEGRIQAQLRHPNLVGVTDVLQFDGRTGLVAEFVDGETLESWLRRNGPPAISEALDLFAPILAAVAAAHGAGVLHRDLKPSNVLLAPGGIPKVTDFGIARLWAENPATATGPATIVGTPGYMAPEQLSVTTKIGPASDIFALGALLYEVLTGVPAFASADLRETVNATADGRYADIEDLLPDLDSGTVSAVRRALATRPEDRFEDCVAFARALYAEGDPRRALVESAAVPAAIRTPSASDMAPLTTPTIVVPSEPPSLAPLHREGTQRRTGPWLVGGGVLATVVAALLWVAMRPAEDPTVGGESAVVAVPVASTPPVAARAEPAPIVGVVPAGVPAASSPVPVPPSTVPASPSTVSVPSSSPSPSSAAAPASTPAAGAVVAASPSPEPAVASAPAATQDVTAPVVADAGAAEPPPVVTSPLVGAWWGRWSGRPLLVTIERVDANTATGRAEVLMGATTRSWRLVGTVSGEGFSLVDTAASGFRVDGKYSPAGLSGTVTPASGGATAPWTATRK